MDKQNEERLQTQDAQRAKVVADLKAIVPNIEITGSEKCPSFNYYVASVVGSKVVVSKESRSIYIKDDAAKIINGKYLTEKEARAAIERVLPKAKEKFEQCLLAYLKVQNDMGFSYGFNYDGDTHGIYNEYDYISFKMDGFYFQFRVSQ